MNQSWSEIVQEKVDITAKEDDSSEGHTPPRLFTPGGRRAIGPVTPTQLPLVNDQTSKVAFANLRTVLLPSQIQCNLSSSANKNKQDWDMKQKEVEEKDRIIQELKDELNDRESALEFQNQYILNFQGSIQVFCRVKPIDR